MKTLLISVSFKTVVCLCIGEGFWLAKVGMSERYDRVLLL